MGIQGLLPMLKSVMDQVSVTKYKGKTVGIDASGWLYKGCYSCATDIVLGRETDSYLNFCLQQIKVLEEHGIRPIFVFDGAPLPAKADLNAARFRTRVAWKQRAIRSLEETGENNPSAFHKAISVSNSMIMKFIAILRRMNIEFIVAPYEADAQLAFLSKAKLIDCVISEDSDCVPYGCRTTLFKWSGDGWATELKRRSLGANEDLSFVGWTDDMFVQLCVLCGCDYCPSLPGVGIVTAYKLVNLHKDPLQVIAALQAQRKEPLPAHFKMDFIRAILTFRHHLVFDPRDQKLKMLNPLSVSGELPQAIDNDLQFLGNMELMDAVVASIAQGAIHPVTHESYAWGETVHASPGIAFQEDVADSLTSSETSSIAELRSRVTQSGPSRGAVDEPLATSNQRTRHAGALPKSGRSSWRHLDGVLGTSQHILNFSSPKVSDNFKSLISMGSNCPAPQSTNSNAEIRAIGDAPSRPVTKRPRNPRNRVREGQRSGFVGEVSCHVDANEPAVNKRRRQDPEVIAPHRLQGDKQQDQASMNYPTSLESSQVRSPGSSVSEQFRDHEADEADDAVNSSGEYRSDIFNAVAARRASTVEEKWDRILQESNESSDDEERTQATSETSGSLHERRSFATSFRSLISKGMPSFTSST